jgi:hypothetical protein
MKGGWLPGLIPPGHHSELEGPAANETDRRSPKGSTGNLSATAD